MGCGSRLLLLSADVCALLMTSSHITRYLQIRSAGIVVRKFTQISQNTTAVGVLAAFCALVAFQADTNYARWELGTFDGNFPTGRGQCLTTLSRPSNRESARGHWWVALPSS